MAAAQGAGEKPERNSPIAAGAMARARRQKSVNFIVSMVACWDVMGGLECCVVKSAKDVREMCEEEEESEERERRWFCRHA